MASSWWLRRKREGRGEITGGCVPYSPSLPQRPPRVCPSYPKGPPLAGVSARVPRREVGGSYETQALELKLLLVLEWLPVLNPQGEGTEAWLEGGSWGMKLAQMSSQRTVCFRVPPFAAALNS